MPDSFSFGAVNSLYFTPSQIQRIENTVVGIAGAGGLGSNCALCLVRSGFSKFIIADYDTVELSNLNRQAYRYTQINQPKVVALQENLLVINPDCAITWYHDKLESDTIESVFGTADVVVEAFDDPTYKAMLTEAYAYSGKFFVGASGLGGYGNSDRIVTRKMHSTFFIVGDGTTEVTGTTMPFAPCVTIAAAKQADLVLEWVLG